MATNPNRGNRSDANKTGTEKAKGKPIAKCLRRKLRESSYEVEGENFCRIEAVAKAVAALRGVS